MGPMYKAVKAKKSSAPKKTSPSTIIRPVANPKFISVEDADIQSSNKLDGFRFTLVSYNLLAWDYLKPDKYTHSPSASLKLKRHLKSNIEILKNLGADFFCLQEVDKFDEVYKGKMLELGYSAIYMQRPNRSDGCAVFYKQDRVELILEEKIDYNDLVFTIQMENSSNDYEHNNVQTTQLDGEKDVVPEKGSMRRDCIGVLVAFKFKDTYNQFLIVANTHLYWDHEFADVKLAQAKYLLSRLAQFKASVSDRYECVPEVVVAGDFNSQPGDTVYQYLIQEAPIPLLSVYASTRGEPEFTNYTPKFIATLDYIFFCSSGNLKPVSYLELPDSDATDIIGGLPNFIYPSDHLPIGAEFKIIKE